jgi:hypothetical protein
MGSSSRPDDFGWKEFKIRTPAGKKLVEKKYIMCIYVPCVLVYSAWYGLVISITLLYIPLLLQ